MCCVACTPNILHEQGCVLPAEGHMSDVPQAVQSTEDSIARLMGCSEIVCAAHESDGMFATSLLSITECIM